VATGSIKNVGGNFGQTDLQTSLPGVMGEFKSSAAITALSVVAIGTDGTVATIATDGTAALQVGVALKAAASGRAVPVQLLGIAENVPCDGAVAAGGLLKRSVTTAGRVQATATPAVGEVIGVAINASASNTVDVWVCKAAALS
jgi:hypothetical protein